MRLIINMKMIVMMSLCLNIMNVMFIIIVIILNKYFVGNDDNKECYRYCILCNNSLFDSWFVAVKCLLVYCIHT